MDKVYSFWSSWGNFTTFQYKNKNASQQLPSSKNEVELSWNYCKAIVPEEEKCIKKSKFMGITINQEYETNDEKSKRLKTQNKLMKDLSKLSSSSIEKISNEFEWTIWKEIICLEANLQWIKWNKTFCFYWLIDWIKRTQKCPNWVESVSYYSLKLNKNIKNNIETKILASEPKEFECSKHNKVCNVFCLTWKVGVWGNWVVLKFHNDHDLANIDELYDDINK